MTITFGVLLILVGIAGFVCTGHTHPTALIPAFVGLLFILFGSLANTEDSKKRMLWMHIAVTVGLLGFIGTVPAAVDVFRLAHGTEFPHPIAIEEKAAMSLLCLLYVAFCVRSFMAARRARAAA